MIFTFWWYWYYDNCKAVYHDSMYPPESLVYCFSSYEDGHYICTAFIHWLKPFSWIEIVDGQWVLFGPDVHLCNPNRNGHQMSATNYQLASHDFRIVLPILASLEEKDRLVHQNRSVNCLKGLIFLYGLTLIPARPSNHMPSKVPIEITDPFPNSNGYTEQIWELLSESIPYFIVDVITYPCLHIVTPYKNRPQVANTPPTERTAWLCIYNWCWAWITQYDNMNDIMIMHFAWIISKLTRHKRPLHIEYIPYNIYTVCLALTRFVYVKMCLGLMWCNHPYSS